MRKEEKWRTLGPNTPCNVGHACTGPPLSSPPALQTTNEDEVHGRQRGCATFLILCDISEAVGPIRPFGVRGLVRGACPSRLLAIGGWLARPPLCCMLVLSSPSRSALARAPSRSHISRQGSSQPQPQLVVHPDVVSSWPGVSKSERRRTGTRQARPPKMNPQHKLVLKRGGSARGPVSGTC